MWQLCYKLNITGCDHERDVVETEPDNVFDQGERGVVLRTEAEQQRFVDGSGSDAVVVYRVGIWWSSTKVRNTQCWALGCVNF